MVAPTLGPREAGIHAELSRPMLERPLARAQSHQAALRVAGHGDVRVRARGPRDERLADVKWLHLGIREVGSSASGGAESGRS